MVDEKINIVVSLKDQATKSLKGLSGAFDKLKQNAKIVAVAGIGVLAAAITKTTKLFGAQEDAVKKMEAALSATGQEVKQNSKDLQKYASELQKVTTVGDETSLAVMQMGLNMGLSATQTKQATKDAIGLSKAYGVDMSAAMKAVAAAQKGDYNMLNRYIPSLRSFKDETEKATEAKRLLAAAFDVAKAETQTLNGAMAQMKNAMGDAGEAIGSVFAPMLQKAAGFVKGIAERFSNLNPATQKTIVVIGALVIGIGSLIPLLAVMATSIAAISWPVIAVVAGIAALTTGVVMLSSKINEVGGVTNFLKNSFISLAQIMIDIITGPIKMFLKGLQTVFDAMNKITGGKINLSVQGAIDNLDKLNEKLEEHKVTRLEKEAEIEDASTEQKLAKNEERNAILTEQELAQREEKKALMAELDAIDNEEDLAKFEAKLEQKALQGELETQQELAIEQKRSELKKANWKKEFSTWLGIEKLKVINKQSTAQQMNNWEQFMLAGTRSKNKEVAAIAKALAIKDVTFKTAQAAMSAYQSLAAIPIAGPVLGAAAAAAAISFGAEQIQSIQSQGTAMAEGGVVLPTPGGTQATIGEAGSAEAVIPLDDPEATQMMGGGGDTQVNVYISGKPLAKEMYETQQEMIRTGELQA